jgi:hypothetical protein
MGPDNESRDLSILDGDEIVKKKGTIVMFRLQRATNDFGAS